MVRTLSSYNDFLRYLRWPGEFGFLCTQPAVQVTPTPSKNGGKGLQSGGFWGKEMMSGAKHAGLRRADSRPLGSVRAK